MKVAKNKVAPPFRIAEFDIEFGRGINAVGCLLDLAEETGVVARKGGWYSYAGDNLGQGRDNTVRCLEKDDTLRQTIDNLVRQKLSEGSAVMANSLRPIAASTAKSPEDDTAHLPGQPATGDAQAILATITRTPPSP